MNGIRKVPTRYLVLLCDALHKHGVDTPTLLQTAGIDAKKFDCRDAALDPIAMDAFLASARNLSGRTDLGFEQGRRIKMTSHDLLGYGMLSCRTFDEVLRLVARHFHLMTETFTLCYQRSIATGVGEAIYIPAVAMSREVLHFHLEALAVAHDNQLRQILPIGMGSAGYDIYISMPPPAHLTRYLALAPTRFHFDEGSLPGVRVVMGQNVLECPLPFSDARMVREVDQRCGDMAPRRHRTSGDWVEYLRMMLRHVEGDIPTLESIARANQVSPRTIERHLNRENISFRELLHQTRFERACQLLRGSLIPVTQVAHQLGFSNAANFSRAFRRVIGTTPAIYRERSLAPTCLERG